jgi:hypothetical protein
MLYKGLPNIIANATPHNSMILRNPKGALHPRRINSPFILSGLAYCNECSIPLSGRTIKKKNGGRWSYYRCPNTRLADNSCPGISIPKVILEEKVLETVKEYILAPSHLIHLYELQKETNQQHLALLQPRLEQYRRQSVTNKKAITNLLAAIRERGHSKSLLDELDRLESEQEAINTEITQLRKQIHQHNPNDYLDLDQLQERAQSIAQRIRNAPISEQRIILRGLIDSINITRKNDVIYGRIAYYTTPFLKGFDSYTFTNLPSTV